MPLDYYISRYMVYTVHIHTSIYLSSVLMLIECVGIYQARFITSRFAVLFSLCPSLAHTSVPLFFSIAFRMVLCGGAHSTWCGLCILKHAIYHPNREENNNTICTSHSSSGFVCCGCVYGWMAGSLVRVHVRIADEKAYILYYVDGFRMYTGCLRPYVLDSSFFFLCVAPI